MNMNKNMNKKVSLIAVMAVLSSCGFFSGQAFAADLLDVYKQALASDPVFKAANQQWLAERENVPINRAALLPQLSASGGVSRIRSKGEGSASRDHASYGNYKYYDNQTAYGLTLTQPIFNFSDWAALWSAKASVKQAEAVFFSSAQDLMFRVASAYLAVLQAQDNLRLTIEQKKVDGELLRQQRQKFEVGLIPITDFNNAQASYDTAAAQEIADRTALADVEEKLQEITGIKYAHQDLFTLKQQLPLVRPEPQNMEQWVKTAEQQNYAMLAVRYGSMAARENIAQKEGGHLPTLNAVGSYDYQYDNNGDGHNQFGRSRDAAVGLQLSVPLFSGGGVSAQARQASHQYQQMLSVEEQTHRSTVSQTRQAYLGVVSGINKIEADRQEIKSKRSALVSMQNSYSVGLRTMWEVLSAESELYDVEKKYAADQYAYILDTLNLKEQAGVLSANDLAKINLWLEKSSLAVSLEAKDYSKDKKEVADQGIFSEASEIDKAQPASSKKDVANKSAKKSSKTVAEQATAGTTSATTVVNATTTISEQAKDPIATLSMVVATPVVATPPVVAVAEPTNGLNLKPVEQPLQPVVTQAVVAQSVSAQPAVAGQVATVTQPQPQAAAQVQQQTTVQSQVSNQPQAQAEPKPQAPGLIALKAPEASVTPIAAVLETKAPVVAAPSPAVVAPIPAVAPPIPVATQVTVSTAANAVSAQITPVLMAPVVPVVPVVPVAPAAPAAPAALAAPVAPILPAPAAGAPAIADHPAPVAATSAATPVLAKQSSSQTPVSPVSVVVPQVAVAQVAPKKVVAQKQVAAPKSSAIDAKANVKAQQKVQRLTRPEKYILKKVDPKHYTLQLMKSDDKQALINFAHGNNLQDKTILYTGYDHGVQYYGLIYGDYENAGQADSALQKLTEKLTEKGVIKVMQFEILQKELSEHRGAQ